MMAGLSALCDPWERLKEKRKRKQTNQQHVLQSGLYMKPHTELQSLLNLKHWFRVSKILSAYFWGELDVSAVHPLHCRQAREEQSACSEPSPGKIANGPMVLSREYNLSRIYGLE